jgi:shikimate kinase
MMSLKKSISFVGMAGCGKTTIGRLFAKKNQS